MSTSSTSLAPAKRLIQHCLFTANSLLFDRSYFTIFAGLVIFGDVVLTQLIIRFVPYTEIDWETYMRQVSLFIKGERDYVNLTGPTGPLVYPAGHVYIHKELYDITMEGRNIPLAQQLYGALYIVSLALTCGVYHQSGSIPNWVLLLLPLSKRLHSLYALRLFNDCWAAVLSQAAVFTLQRRSDLLGTALLSLALSIKMSVLLFIPGLLVVLFRRHGAFSTAGYIGLLCLLQSLLGLPFLLANSRSYLAGAFDLSRAFLYKWTVNWRFFSEEIFSSPLLAQCLLIAHATALLAFGARKWCASDGGVFAVLNRGLRRPNRSPAMVTVDADYVATVLYTSNLIGILFARSLHYQFYAWYAQQLPLLVWRTKYPIPIKLSLLLCIEYAWNVFPSTPLSSGILFGANFLLSVGIWFGFPEGIKLTQKVPKMKVG